MMDFAKLNKMQLTENYFKKHFPDIYEQLIKLAPKKFQEKIYWYINNLKNYPKCPCCGGEVKFLTISQGYRVYCCCKCSNSSQDKICKTKQTNIDKYGGVAPMCSTQVREKSIKTCLEKYGYEYATQSPKVKEKTINTCLGKYGRKSVGSVKEFKEKAKETCIEKYGGVGFQSDILNKKSKDTNKVLHGDPNYNNYQQSINTQIKKYGGVGNASLELKDKYRGTHRQRFVESNDFLIGYTKEGNWICKCPHHDCNKCQTKTYITTSQIETDRKRSSTELCTNILPIQQSHSTNTTIELFVQKILDDIGVQYETNKNILDRKQLDIWIPSKNIGIELNGVFHHSTCLKEPKYHINKYIKAKSKGIRLLTFWSDQIYSKPNIVKSMIITKLGLCKDMIYARKCIIKEVDQKTSFDFLEKNHIQGHTNATYRIGLYCDDKLVSLMTFSRSTTLQGAKNDNTWKLTRFCSLLNTRVVGAASKLLSFFIKTYKPTEIVSFSSNDISDGGLYKRLNFTTDGKINKSYFYIKGNKRWHRSSFTKSKIVELGWKSKNDKTWTEREVMSEHKYLCIYDSGTTKWVLKL